MAEYKHILLAIDYSAHDDAVAEKARDLAQSYQAKLSLVHVLDNIPMPDTSYGTVISLLDESDDDVLEAEKNKLSRFAERFGIPDEHCCLIWGVPKEEIVSMANRENVDLIVLGSHGRHGLALLLGSTANSVLHHAQCDVLAVRLQDD